MNADIAPEPKETAELDLKAVPMDDLTTILLNPATLSPAGGTRLSVAAQALSSHQRRRTAALLKEIQEKKREQNHRLTVPAPVAISKEATVQACSFATRGNDSSKLLANELAASHGQLRLNIAGQHPGEAVGRETDQTTLNANAVADLIFESGKPWSKKRTEQMRSSSPPHAPPGRDCLEGANGTPETLMEESRGQQTLDFGESTRSGGPILFENVKIPNITMTTPSTPPGAELGVPSLQLK